MVALPVLRAPWARMPRADTPPETTPPLSWLRYSGSTAPNPSTDLISLGEMKRRDWGEKTFPMVNPWRPPATEFSFEIASCQVSDADSPTNINPVVWPDGAVLDAVPMVNCAFCVVVGDQSWAPTAPLLMVADWTPRTDWVPLVVAKMAPGLVSEASPENHSMADWLAAGLRAKSTWLLEELFCPMDTLEFSSMLLAPIVPPLFVNAEFVPFIANPAVLLTQLWLTNTPPVMVPPVMVDPMMVEPVMVPRTR